MNLDANAGGNTLLSMCESESVPTSMMPRLDPPVLGDPRSPSRAALLRDSPHIKHASSWYVHVGLPENAAVYSRRTSLLWLVRAKNDGGA